MQPLHAQRIAGVATGAMMFARNYGGNEFLAHHSPQCPALLKESLQATQDIVNKNCRYR